MVLFMAAAAYFLLQHAIIASEGPASILKTAIGSDWKGKLSPVLYLVAIAATFISPWIAQSIYVLVALIWLVPDRRIEQTLKNKQSSGASSRPANLLTDLPR